LTAQKMRKVFLNTMQKFRLKIPNCYWEIVKKQRVHSVMMSMTMLIQSHYPS